MASRRTTKPALRCLGSGLRAAHAHSCDARPATDRGPTHNAQADKRSCQFARRAQANEQTAERRGPSRAPELVLRAPERALWPDRIKLPATQLALAAPPLLLLLWLWLWRQRCAAANASAAAGGSCLLLLTPLALLAPPLASKVNSPPLWRRAILLFPAETRRVHNYTHHHHIYISLLQLLIGLDYPTI